MAHQIEFIELIYWSTSLPRVRDLSRYTASTYLSTASNIYNFAGSLYPTNEMFLARELKKYAEIGSWSETAESRLGEAFPTTQSTQSTAPLDLGPFRFVDLLNTWDLLGETPLYLLVSDGERQAVAVAARSVYEPFKRQIDSNYDNRRMLLIRHMGFVPWKRELIPQELADFISLVNGCEAVLKVSAIQLRGGAWLAKTTGPRPPRYDELGPLPSKQQSSPFRIPSTFQAERPQQFAPVQYSDDNEVHSPILSADSESDTPPNTITDGMNTAEQPVKQRKKYDTEVVEKHDDDSRRQDKGVSSPDANSKESSEVRKRLNYDSEANFEQLILYGTRQGMNNGNLSQQQLIEPEILSQAPSQASQFSQVCPLIESEISHIDSQDFSLTPTPSTTNEDETWTEAEEKALVFGIVYLHGARWDELVELYGQNGAISDDLKAKSMRQLRNKASSMKHELIKNGKNLPPGFETVPLYPEDSQIERKRLKLDTEMHSLSVIHSDSPDDPFSDLESDSVSMTSSMNGTDQSQSNIIVDSQSFLPSQLISQTALQPPSPTSFVEPSQVPSQEPSQVSSQVSSQVPRILNSVDTTSLSRIASSSQSLSSRSLPSRHSDLDNSDSPGKSKSEGNELAIDFESAALHETLEKPSKTSEHEPNESKSCIIV